MWYPLEIENSALPPKGGSLSKFPNIVKELNSIFILTPG
jgi:hypothetical protein